MHFDSTNQIELINQPLLMIAGSKADSLCMSEQAFAKATGTTGTTGTTGVPGRLRKIGREK